MENIEKYENFESQDDLVNKAIKMDSEIDQDPVYKKYETEYMKSKMGDSADIDFGSLGDLLDMDDEDPTGGLGDLLDTLKGSGMEDSPEFKEMFLSDIDGTIEVTEEILNLAKRDNEEDLISKLENYIELLKKIK